tara:strand:- start:39 stop:248 length:210 start_codon:yes stop_codon:yes gene_type:complete
MSKKEVDIKLSENQSIESAAFEGKSNDELKEILQTLQTQFQQYQSMMLKAQGAIEVVGQMLFPKEGDST